MLVAVLLAIATMVAYTFATGISPVPTSPRVRIVMLDALPDDPQGPIFELGSGWGSLAVPVAKSHPRCDVEAFEVSPVPWLFSRVWTWLSGLPNLRVHRSNFHRTDLSSAAAVLCYLYPSGMARLAPKLARELPANAVVVSNFFAIPGWAPVTVRRADDLHRSRVYVYRIPDSLPEPG